MNFYFLLHSKIFPWNTMNSFLQIFLTTCSDSLWCLKSPTGQLAVRNISDDYWMSRSAPPNPKNKPSESNENRRHVIAKISRKNYLVCSLTQRLLCNFHESDAQATAAAEREQIEREKAEMEQTMRERHAKLQTTLSKFPLAISDP